MGQKVPSAIKEKVINAWLEGKPRNIIADETDISYGSVTNIITEAKKESIKDIDLLRAVAVLLKNNGLSLTYLASSIRLKNRLNNFKLNEIQADSFLEHMAIHCFKEQVDPKEFLFQIGRVCSIAEYLNIPIMQLPDFIEEKTKEYKDSIE